MGSERKRGHLGGDLCATVNYDYVNLSFLLTFGNDQPPMINLVGHCDPCNNECIKLSSNIKSCQAKGIKVVLFMDVK